MQARFPRERARIEGDSREFIRNSDDGEPRRFHFCPECGATVYYFLDSVPEMVAIPAGAFADPGFPHPQVSVWESRRHAWVTLPRGVKRDPD
jgi:hypothetical protein